VVAGAQILARARRKLNTLTIRARHRLGLPTLPAVGTVTIAPEFRHPIDPRRREEYVAVYRARFPEAVTAELAEAARLCAHQFRYLGFETRHGARIDWARDPVSGRDWSSGFSPGIAYRGADRLGDIKLPWELAKQQYFFTLGKAYWLTGDPAYAAQIGAQIDSFLDHNPVHGGIHWTSALEGGTRVSSWILAWPFFADTADDTRRVRWLSSLATHLVFVERMLSTGKFANTHLAGEAAILVLGGLFLRCRHSDRWLATGLAHLESQLAHQLRADGAHAEQSIAYHRFFLDQYYLAQAFLEANGRSLSARALERMHAATIYLRDFMTPDGGVLNFGDCDDARALWFRADAPRDYRGLLALGALRFARGDLKWVAGMTEELLWLGGPEALRRYDALPAHAPTERGASYPDAGYFLARSGWDRQASLAVFDCGPLGHGPCGHGHADALSLQLHAAGFTFLTDPGTYAYNIDYAWRDRFRLTAAHNTVMVDDAEQSIPLDRMSWTRAATSHCRRYAAADGFMLVDGEHDGYSRLGAPVTHRRVFAQLDGRAWFVLDCLDGAGDHVIHTRWHLRPECRVAVQDTRVDLSAPDGATLEVNGPAALELTAGWHSDEYGVRVSTQVLTARQHLTGRHRQAWTFSLKGTPATAQVRGAYVRFESGATVLYRLQAGRRHEETDLSFDGELLVLRAGGAMPVLAENFLDLVLDGIHVSSQSIVRRLTLIADELKIEADGEVSVAAPGLRVYIDKSIN